MKPGPSASPRFATLGLILLACLLLLPESTKAEYQCGPGIGQCRISYQLIRDSRMSRLRCPAMPTLLRCLTAMRGSSGLTVVFWAGVGWERRGLT